MVNEQELIDQFKIGLAISLDKVVLEKCSTLCSKYNITEEDFVNDWIAFSLSNSLDSEPTIPALTLLERKQLSNIVSNTPAKNVELKVYHSPKVSKVSSDDIVSSYLQNKTPQRHVESTNKRQLLSPSEDTTKRRQMSTNLSQSQFASVSFNSDVSERSTKYNERTDSESIQMSFGDEALLSKTSWKGKGVLDFNLKLIKQSESYKYMFDESLTNVAVEVENTKLLVRQIMMKHNLTEKNEIDKVLVTEGIFCGRVRKSMSASDENKIELEDQFFGKSYGKRVGINLKNTLEYCLYPGQVVCFSGTNPTGKKICPEKCYTDANTRFPNTKLSINKGSSLQIVIASGPYTLDDNIEYEPLTDFVSYIVKNKPDVVIMIGPFVDVEHQRIADGMLAETFNELFDRLIAGIMEPLSELPTHVVLISSYQDAHHMPVYPTQPYKLRRQYPRLHLCPDPCQIDINGLIIAATSVDVIKHISSLEICKPMTSDRIARVATHLISQRSMYPLSRETAVVPLDSELWKTLTRLDVVPHLMILPSKLKYFIKDIGQCIVINPEVLGKGYKGGTFGRVEVINHQEDKPITSSIIGQILKI